ncbi:MAG: hypothetical protein LBT78_03975, partial [Tannerella sp.]|nr:hypothetical protein [Tannerella sp.]
NSQTVHSHFLHDPKSASKKLACIRIVSVDTKSDSEPIISRLQDAQVIAMNPVILKIVFKTRGTRVV